jgi:prepilin-type N-terminal cleavage/methylation domain-containing protein
MLDAHHRICCTHIMKNKHAFTLTEILIVVAIIGMIAAIGVPLSLNAIKNSHDRAKVMNIASVEAAKEQWAFEYNKAVGASVQWSNISNYMGSGITNLNNLTVNGVAITLNPIGTRASY